MKKLFLLILMSLLYIGVNSQVINSIKDTLVDDVMYPMSISDSTGLYIVFTIEQARVIDNSLEILRLLEQYAIGYESYDSVCIQVINEKEVIIAKQDIQISNLIKSNKNKEEGIKNLQNQVASYKIKESTYKSIIDNKDTEIQTHLNKIDKLERKMTLGGIGGSVIIIAVVFLLLTK